MFACVAQVKPPLQEHVGGGGRVRGRHSGSSDGFVRPFVSAAHRSPPPKPAAGPSDMPTSSKRAEPLLARVSVQRLSASASGRVALVSSNPPHHAAAQTAAGALLTPPAQIHTQLSQPPPLQAHHPVGSSKTPGCSQVRPACSLCVLEQHD